MSIDLHQANGHPLLRGPYGLPLGESTQRHKAGEAGQISPRITGVLMQLFTITQFNIALVCE